MTATNEELELWVLTNYKQLQGRDNTPVVPIKMLIPKEFEWIFKDKRSGINKSIGLTDHTRAIKALKVLADRGDFDHLGFNRANFFDPSYWSPPIVDAFWQLCYYDKIKYDT